MPKPKPPEISLISRTKKGVIHAYQIAWNKNSLSKKTWCGKIIEGTREQDRILNGMTYRPMTEKEMRAAITCKKCIVLGKVRNA